MGHIVFPMVYRQRFVVKKKQEKTGWICRATLSTKVLFVEFLIGPGLDRMLNSTKMGSNEEQPIHHTMLCRKYKDLRGTVSCLVNPFEKCFAPIFFPL